MQSVTYSEQLGWLAASQGRQMTLPGTPPLPPVKQPSAVYTVESEYLLTDNNIQIFHRTTTTVVAVVVVVVVVVVSK